MAELEWRRGEEQHALEAPEQRTGLAALVTLVLEERREARCAILRVVGLVEDQQWRAELGVAQPHVPEVPDRRVQRLRRRPHLPVGVDRAVARKPVKGVEERRDVDLAQRVDKRLGNRVVAAVLPPLAEL